LQAGDYENGNGGKKKVSRLTQFIHATLQLSPACYFQRIGNETLSYQIWKTTQGSNREVQRCGNFLWLTPKEREDIRKMIEEAKEVP